MTRFQPIASALLLAGLAPAQDPALRSSPTSIDVTAPPIAPTTVAPDQRVFEWDVGDLTGHAAREQHRQSRTDAVGDGPRMAAWLERHTALEQDATARAADLTTAIKTLIQPAFEKSRQRLAVVDEERLVLIGDPRQAAWIEGFVGAVRAFRGELRLDATMFILRPGQLDHLLQSSGVVVDGEQCRRIEAAVVEVADERVDTPPLTVAPLQRAHLAVIKQVAYVRDYSVVITGDADTTVADPEIDTLQTGVTLDVVAAPLDSQQVALQCDLVLRAADRPFPTRTYDVAHGLGPVTIQVPEVREIEASARFDLRPDQALVLRSVEPGDADSEQREVVLVLRLTRDGAPR